MVQQARGRQSQYRATARGSRVLCACAARAVCFDVCCACTRRASRSAGMSCLAPFCVRKFPQGKQAACLECTRTLTPGGLVVGRRAASDQEYSEYVHLECSYNPTAVQNAVVRAVMGISESFDIVTIEAGLGAFEKGRIYQHFNDPKTHTEDPSFLLGVRPCGSSQYTKQAFRIEYKGASAAIVQCGVCSAPISEDFDVRVGARVGDFDHYFHWCHLRCWKVPFELTGIVDRSFQRLQQDREFAAAVAIDDRLMNMDAGRVYAHLMTSSNHLPAPPPAPPPALSAVQPRLVVLPARLRVAPALVARADAVGTCSPTMTSGNHLPAPPMVDVQAIETDAVSESLGDIPEVVQGEDAFEGPMGSDDVDQVNEAASDCTVADAEPDAYSDVVDATTPDPADTESCVMDRIESARDLDVGSTQVDASPVLPQFDMQVLPSGGTQVDSPPPAISPAYSPDDNANHSMEDSSMQQFFGATSSPSLSQPCMPPTPTTRNVEHVFPLGTSTKFMWSKQFVLSGTFTDFANAFDRNTVNEGKARVHSAIQALGSCVTKRITSETTALVIGLTPGITKVKEANNRGVPILTLDGLRELASGVPFQDVKHAPPTTHYSDGYSAYKRARSEPSDTSNTTPPRGHVELRARHSSGA